MPRRFTPRSGGGLHNKEWEAVVLNDSPLDLAIGTSVSFTIFTFGKSQTLLRTRGFVYATLNATATSERATIGVGIASVSSKAAAAGGASVPLPVTDGAYPWLWHGYLQVTSATEAAVVNDFLRERIEVDSKAMRKMKEEEVLICVFEIGESTDQGGNVTLGGGFRALVGD